MAKTETTTKTTSASAGAAPVADQPKVDTATGEIAPSNPTPKKEKIYKTQGDVELLNKIAAKTVMGDEFMATKPTVQEDMFTLIGLVRSATALNSQYGDSYKFKGSFKAIRTHDGKKFNSSALYLPRAMEEMIYEQIQTAQADDSGEVQFVVIIGRKPSKKAAVGYEYTYKPVMSVVEYDPLEALEQAAMSAIKSLPAPNA